jgi:hypothetical protein
MRWGRLGLGFVLGVIAGVMFGWAWRGQDWVLWWLAALVLLLGSLITIVAMLRPRILLEPPRRAGGDDSSAPLLGAMLISYQLISEHDLAKALSIQRKSGRRLGKVLVEMGLITSAQVAELLEEQFARREGTFGRIRVGYLPKPDDAPPAGPASAERGTAPAGNRKTESLESQPQSSVNLSSSSGK